MAEILVRLKNHGTLVVDSLEAMRNEHIVTILYTTINITRDDTGKKLSMRPEYEVISEKADYAIKVLWYFFRYRAVSKISWHFFSLHHLGISY
jgi:hypothetical protein